MCFSEIDTLREISMIMRMTQKLLKLWNLLTVMLKQLSKNMKMPS